MTNSNIAEKISKIIAKADSTTSEDEAATFMQKAQDLMMAHGLNLLDLKMLDKDDPLALETLGHSFKSEIYRRRLGATVAAFYGCTMVSINRSGEPNKFYWEIAGRESARMTFSLMFPFIDRQVKQAAKKAHAAGDFKTLSVARSRIGDALTIRIIELMSKNEEKQTTAEITAGNQLVPIDEIKALIKKELGQTKKGKSKLTTNNAGQKAAAGISLNLQATAAGSSRQIAN